MKSHICVTAMSRSANYFGVPVQLFIASFFSMSGLFGLSIFIGNGFVQLVIIIALVTFLLTVQHLLKRDRHAIALWPIKFWRDRGNGKARHERYQKFSHLRETLPHVE